jgi:hypothetical protein
LVAIGVGFAAKTVFNKIILGKAGWVIKLIAPYFAENSRFDLKKLMSRFKNRISSLTKMISKDVDDVSTNIRK